MVAWGTEEDGKGQDGSVTNTKGQRKLWGMMATFIILIGSDDFKGV